MIGVLRLGTRASTLAVSQSRIIADEITRLTGMPVELVTITTHGDVSQEPLASMGGTGVFASALRESLLAGECDFLVHSLKDLPTAPYPGLFIAAIPEREDARDAVCARDGMTLASLPAGATVGTGSPRRRAQLLAMRPDLHVVGIRGNVDTRLATVASGALDAVILAAAGLTRIGRAGAITELVPLHVWPTAAGQGALALEAREGTNGADVIAILATVDDLDSRLTVTAEREVLAGLEAGCSAPIGVSATLTENSLGLVADVYGVEGSERLRREVRITIGPENRAALASGAALALVDSLLEAGADEIAPLGNRE